MSDVLPIGDRAVHEASTFTGRGVAIERALGEVAVLRPDYAKAVQRTRIAGVQQPRGRWALLERIRFIEAARREAERRLSVWWRKGITEAEVVAAYDDVLARMRSFVNETLGPR